MWTGSRPLISNIKHSLMSMSLPLVGRGRKGAREEARWRGDEGQSERGEGEGERGEGEGERGEGIERESREFKRGVEVGF